MGSAAGIVRDLQATDNHKARGLILHSLLRLRWPAIITEDNVKDDQGNKIEGKYQVKVGGLGDDPLDAYITRPDERFKKNDVVEVNVDLDNNCWILSPSLPRGTGFGACLMIIDDKSPGTWGVSYPRMLSSSSFGVVEGTP